VFADELEPQPDAGVVPQVAVGGHLVGLAAVAEVAQGHAVVERPQRAARVAQAHGEPLGAVPPAVGLAGQADVHV
jgi:hypothetical protein